MHMIFRTQRCPGKSDQPDGLQRCDVQKPVEAGFRLERIGILATNRTVSVNERKEGEVGDEVANDDRDKSQTLGSSTEVPLLVDRLE